MIKRISGLFWRNQMIPASNPKGDFILRYYSTRNQGEYKTAAEAIKKGLADDGGLYVPAERAVPFKKDNLPRGSYTEIADVIFKLFLTDFDAADMEKAIASAYNDINFDHPLITPLHKLSPDLHVMELWHGPTYAFKDIALQILPHFLRTAIKVTGEKSEVVVLAATSGDTGKSALEGFSNVSGTRIIVYFPEGGVSEVQQLQMTTQEGDNVGVAAVRGNFDDTQNGVKELFNDRKLKERLEKSGYRLSSANSINWGRLLPQIVYYFAAYRDLLSRGELQPEEKVNFVVPTGNFGNILAGYYARELGLPVNRLICAANRNNVLSDFINTGRYLSRRPLHQTFSPSMDILVSSNLERLLFEITEHDPRQIVRWMDQLKNSGEYEVDPETLQKLQGLFWADYADDRETLQIIAETYRYFHYLIDTHTAVGLAVLQKYRTEEKDNCHSVLLSTASPFKFSGSVIKALFDGEKYSGVSELDLLHILSRETGNPVPANLALLHEKPVKHKQVVGRQDMRDHLLDALDL